MQRKIDPIFERPVVEPVRADPFERVFDIPLEPPLGGATGTSTIPSYEELTKSSPGGYHLNRITKGQLGEISKIEEEFSEFLDAADQGVDIMQLVELSDLLGAISAWLERHHPSITLDQVIKMAEVTKRAFKSGARK